MSGTTDHLQKGVRVLLGCLFLGSGMRVAAAPTTADADRLTWCFAPETDPADRVAIMGLYGAAKFDRRLNMVSRSLDRAAVGRLDAGVRSGRPSVEISALVLLASAVAQDAVPRETRIEIAEAATPLAESADDSIAAKTVRLYAQRVLWHLRVTAIEGRTERAVFLTPFLSEVGTDAPYLAYSAVDYLAEIGAEGEAVLRRLIVEGSKRSIDPDLLERAKLGVRKVELARLADQAGPADAVTILAAAARTPIHRQMDREFGKWIVGQLATRRPEADSQLQALASDDGVSEDVQVAARFAVAGGGASIRWRW